MSNQIDKLNYFMQKVVPQVYDGAASYYELVNKVIDKLNEVVASSNEYFAVDLTTYAEGVLQKWKDDGTLETLINETALADVNQKIEANTTQLAQNVQHSLNGKKFLSISAYQRKIPENNDLGRFTRAIADAEEGMVLSLKDESVFQVPSTITISKKVHLIGNDVELQTITPGLDKTIEILNVDGIIISGIKFNQNLMGRTSLRLSNCTNFLIQGCYFTGYSKQYSYANTDGGIKLDDCTNGKIIFNKWISHGEQYTSATADLNRCITIQGTLSDNIIVMGNTFNKVNQGIVASCGNHIITGNTFNEVQDNCIYMVGAKSVIFTGNYIDQRYDEAFVIDAGKATITSNYFLNVPNKVIAIGKANSPYPIELIVSGNTFDNTDINSGQFIVWRDPSYTASLLVVVDNQFKCPSNVNDYDYFSFGNVSRLVFKDNTVDVATKAFQRILYFNGTSAKASIKNNTFTGTDSSAKAIEVAGSVVSPDVLFEDNELINCRGILTGVRVNGQKVQFNVGPYINNKPKLNRIYCDSVPTSGTWNQGDYAVNTTPTIMGASGVSKYVIKGWTRITTGSNNVLNTDWVEDRSLTGQ